MPAALSVLLAEGIPRDRIRTRHALETDGGFRIVGEAATVGEAITLSGSLQPDAVILDLAADGSDGEAIEGIRRLSPASRIVALTDPIERQDGPGIAYVGRNESPSAIASALISLDRRQ